MKTTDQGNIVVGERRIYVIGKVTGVKDLNRPKFEEAAQSLERAGYVALIPHWFVPESASWDTAMKRSIETLVKCDGVALLDDHTRSAGATIEKNLAFELGIPVRPVKAWIQ